MHCIVQYFELGMQAVSTRVKVEKYESMKWFLIFFSLLPIYAFPFMYSFPHLTLEENKKGGEKNFMQAGPSVELAHKCHIIFMYNVILGLCFPFNPLISPFHKMLYYQIKDARWRAAGYKSSKTSITQTGGGGFTQNWYQSLTYA